MIDKSLRFLTGIKRRKGQGMTEYIIIVGLIALSAIVVVALFGKQIKAQFSAMTSTMSGEDAEVDATAAESATEEVDTGSLSEYKANEGAAE